MDALRALIDASIATAAAKKPVLSGASTRRSLVLNILAAAVMLAVLGGVMWLVVTHKS
jgi:hypothetical protein